MHQPSQHLCGCPLDLPQQVCVLLMWDAPNLLSCFYTVLSSEKSHHFHLWLGVLFLRLTFLVRQINNESFRENSLLSNISYLMLLWSYCGAVSFTVGIFTGIVMKQVNIIEKIVQIS